MPNDHPRQPITVWTRVDRRASKERRGGGERRQSSPCDPAGDHARPYGFRSFDDRRRARDRRLDAENEIGWEGAGSTWPEPVWGDDYRCDPDADDILIDVTPYDER